MSEPKPAVKRTPRKPRSPKKPANATPPAAPPAAPESVEEVSPLTVFGNITPEANQAILQMRDQSGRIINEIGRMEVRKSQLLHQLNQMEAQTQGILKAEAQKLQIRDGTPWQLTPEGVALGVPKGG